MGLEVRTKAGLIAAWGDAAIVNTAVAIQSVSNESDEEVVVSTTAPAT
ncbi:hypothetical protein AB0I39_32200 [Kitasatospora purpeofusca]